MEASHEERLAAVARLEHVKLATTSLHRGTLIRIIKDIYPSGLGYSATAESRFSDPNRKFGVIYFATRLSTAVAEVIVRDRKVGDPDTLRLSYNEAVKDWRAVFVNVRRRLRLIDLTGPGLIGFGIDPDIVRGKSQWMARQLSRAIHANRYDSVDGILYDSRLTAGTCLVLYDRGLSGLAIDEERRLSRMMSDLGPIYRSMRIKVRRPPLSRVIRALRLLAGLGGFRH